MNILLLRNPAVAQEGICCGRTDIPLHPDWLSRLSALKQALPSPMPRLYASPSSRCLVVAGLLGGSVQVDERLNELDYGSWEGIPWRELPQDEVAVWMEDLEEATPHGGESGTQLLERVAEFLDEMIERDEDVLLLADVGWIRAALTLLLNSDLDHICRLDIDHLALTCLNFEGDLVSISYINRKL